MYPSDFNAAEAVYTPAEGDLFLGVSPLLALALLLALLLVALVAYRTGHRQATRDGGPDADKAPDEIYKAILAASTAAMAASSDELRFRAQALRTAINDHLGPVLDLAKGVSGLAKALDDALKGEVKTEVKPDTPPPAPAGHEPKGVQGCGCGQPKACSCNSKPATPAITVTHVVVGGPPAPACGCQPDQHASGCGHPAPLPPEKPAPPPRPEMRPMTGPEQIDALSRAVRQFHDHWSRGPDRVRELQLARAALCRRPLPPRSEKQGASVRERR